MSSERRYNEQEIAAIFKQAAEEQEAAQRRLSPGGELTLAEIEQIGEEAGIPAEFIARAATAVDRPTSLPTRPSNTLLGLPVSIARTVDLPGPFSDEDWDRLVADLHDLYEAPGTMQRDGSLRQWQNDYLHVLVEPAGAGHRLRLRGRNPYPWILLSGGLLFFLMGLFFMLLLAAKGDFAVDVAKTLFVSAFAVVGLGGMGAAVYQFPRWKEKAEHQMEAIVARALERAGPQPTPSAPEKTPDEAPSPRLDLDLPADPEESDPARTRNRTRT